MNTLMYHDPILGRDVPSWLSAAVDELLGKIRHKDVWEILEFCIDIWAKKYPEEHKKYLADMKSYKAVRLNKHGSTQSGSMRELVLLPRELNFLLDKIASDKIAEYGPKKFWRELARRYPGFSPVDTI